VSTPTPLLSTKLYLPPARPNRVPRSRLIARLNDAVARPLTLIAASAGFGKTTLVSDWIAQSEHCVTWLSLDDGDNDPTRFWAYVTAALQRLRAAGSLGDLPLVVLSGEPDLGRVPPDFPADKVRETARALQVELAQLSTNSTHIVCDTYGHYIPLTNPELVVQAIHQVIER